jgi:hypothetical protein
LHIKTLKSPPKLLKIIKKFIKVQDIKLTCKNHLGFYALKMNLQKKKGRKQSIPFTIASKILRDERFVR